MKRRNLESQHQQALVRWAQTVTLPTLPHIEPGARLADYLFAIPNGGSRGKLEAAIMKGEGVKAGVHDLHLPLPLYGWAGAWVEMKAPYADPSKKNYPSKEQKAWAKRMALAGYAVKVCWGWFEAQEFLSAYVGGLIACEVAEGCSQN